MATISQLISAQIPQTEADLQSGGLGDFAIIKALAVQRAKIEFYASSSIPAEDAINDLVKFYLSDVAVVYLSETAIDWYQSKTVLSENQGGEEVVRFYDRVANLRQKRKDLMERIGKARDVISAIAFGSDDPADIAGLPVAQAQAESRGKITKDPWQNARFLYGDLIRIAEGIEPKTIQVDRP